MEKNIADIRKDYVKGSMVVSHMPENPIIAFQQWLNEAIESQVEEPTAFNLSTISKEGQPHSRIVLLKGIENDNLVFFTNYKSVIESNKINNLLNDSVSLVFLNSFGSCKTHKLLLYGFIPYAPNLKLTSADLSKSLPVHKETLLPKSGLFNSALFFNMESILI